MTTSSKKEIIIESQRQRYQRLQKKGNQRVPHKHIYHINNKYVITKSVNGKNTYYKSFTKLDDAIDYRDKLIENNWEPLPVTAEEIEEKNIKEYFKGVTLSSNHRTYKINNFQGNYIGTCRNIQEALYYRDQCYHKTFKESKRPYEMDLETNNPYYDGLKYTTPIRLIPFKNTDSNYGKGTIVKKGEYSYHIHQGSRTNRRKRYICACRTYEQAYYVKKEMNKCNWDKTQLQRILDDYPKWYTWLMEFWRYVVIDKKTRERTGKTQYFINIPSDYLEEGKTLDRYGVYTKAEDALFERDYLMEHDWDYEELVECIDDTCNPYYDMELPPYPQRKIRNIAEKNYHDNELTMIHEMINEEEGITLDEIAERLDVSVVTIRLWLRKGYNTNYREFKRISLGGENPITVLEKVEHFYTPDLSRPHPSNFKGWIQKNKSQRCPFQIVKDDVRYGSYHTHEMARKAVKKLIKCDWDKSKVPEIMESVGVKTLNDRGNIYPNNNDTWSIRKKNKERKMIGYGTYSDYDLAVLVRDLLKEEDWDKELYPSLREYAEYVMDLVKGVIPGRMFL